MPQARVSGVLLLLLAAVAGFSKSPAENSTVCDRYQHSGLIFTGSSETFWITMLDTHKSPVHKRSEKSKRVRFLVREWFKGQRRNTVEVWMTPGECTLSLEANRTYLVYARLNQQNGRVESNGCMGTVAADTAGPDLSYLTAALHGPDHATRISGNAGGPGLNVLAKSGIDNRYAAADDAGRFTLDGLAAGDWTVSVVGGESKQVHLEPSSCVELVLPGAAH